MAAMAQIKPKSAEAMPFYFLSYSTGEPQIAFFVECLDSRASAALESTISVSMAGFDSQGHKVTGPSPIPRLSGRAIQAAEQLSVLPPQPCCSEANC